MMFLSLWTAWLAFKKRNVFQSKIFLKATVLATPLGFLGTEAGWVAIEVGRQPWVVGYVNTAEAVTPVPGLTIPLIFFVALYTFLAFIVIWLMLRHISATPKQCEMMPHTEGLKLV